MIDFKKSFGAIVTAAIVSVGVGLYTKNMTGVSTTAFFRGGAIFVVSIVMLFLLIILENIRKKCNEKGERAKSILISVLFLIICVLYIIIFARICF